MMAVYREKGGRRREVEAIQIIVEPEAALDEIVRFFMPLFDNVDLMLHPPRIKVSHGKRSFTALLGEWVVHPTKDAYFKLADSAFQERYELAGD